MCLTCPSVPAPSTQPAWQTPTLLIDDSKKKSYNHSSQQELRSTKKEPSITLPFQLLTFPVTADLAMTITEKSYHDFINSPTAPTLGW